MTVVEQRRASSHSTERPALDEAAARRTLRAQIARIERELAAATAAAAPCDRIVWETGSHAGPRLLTLGDLEQTRDALVQRLHDAHATLAARAAREARMRERLHAVLLAPGHHRFVRITREEVGLPGCGAWHVRPRFGLIGMLMGWWQVKLSSGCPLP